LNSLLFEFRRSGRFRKTSANPAVSRVLTKDRGPKVFKIPYFSLLSREFRCRGWFAPDCIIRQRVCDRGDFSEPSFEVATCPSRRCSCGGGGIARSQASTADHEAVAATRPQSDLVGPAAARILRSAWLHERLEGMKTSHCPSLTSAESKRALPGTATLLRPRPLPSTQKIVI
jgi:hypothetical protein